MTDSMKAAIDETARRRGIQQEYNAGTRHHAAVDRQGHRRGPDQVYERDYLDYTKIAEDKDIYLSPLKRKKRMEELEKLMKEAAKALEFEKAARIRDELTKLKKRELELGL